MWSNRRDTSRSAETPDRRRASTGSAGRIGGTSIRRPDRRPLVALAAIALGLTGVVACSDDTDDDVPVDEPLPESPADDIEVEFDDPAEDLSGLDDEDGDG